MFGLCAIGFFIFSQFDSYFRGMYDIILATALRKTCGRKAYGIDMKLKYAMLAVVFWIAALYGGGLPARSPVALDGDFEIVVPDAASSGFAPHLAAAGRDLSRAFKEGQGWNVPVVQAAAAKTGGRTIYVGREFAVRDGLGLCEPL